MKKLYTVSKNKSSDHELLMANFRLKKVGTTQRDGMGREEGGGFRMGNTCIPVVDSF